MVCVKEIYYRGLADWYTGVVEMSSDSRTTKVAGIAKVYRASLALHKSLRKWKASMHADPEFAELIEDHLKLAQQVRPPVNPRACGVSCTHAKERRLTVPICGVNKFAYPAIACFLRAR